MPLDQISDGIDELEECSLLERVWDSKRHDHAFRLLPITRKFTYQELRKRPGEEQKMLSHLASWYEGRDVTEEQRPYIVAVRQGERDPDVHLVDAAIQLRREGKARRAEELFQKAIDRAPESWKARKEYAELLRDKGDLSAALEQWEHAVRQVPRKGRDRAIVCREYANTLRKAGSRDNLSTAVDCYEAALRETPNDVLSIHGLAVAHVRLGHNMKAVPLLEELTSDRDPETRKRSYELLIECYSKLGDPIKRTETEKRQANDIQAHGVEVRSKRTVEASSNPTIRRRGKQRRGRKL